MGEAMSEQLYEHTCTDCGHVWIGGRPTPPSRDFGACGGTSFTTRAVCGECGHPESDHVDDDGWSECEHGAYEDRYGFTCLPCNCGNNIGR